MIGRILGNRYELVEKIGEGGMGLVYKAKCHLLNRYVAVKILKPELTNDEEFINRFRKESLSSASLSHPNIVNVYDVGVEDGIYYIVMEYVKGKTLKEIIKERAPLPYQEVINISRQICLALDHAHSNNIIHRDIKPQNILITNDGIVKVADFGIARASNSSTLTNTGNVIGSVYYISPEQARGGYTDRKTDIYSLGTVMYEMATGKVTFVAESPVVIALKHIQEEVEKPSNINPDIPPALEDIILKCLQKNPEARYESAAALIKDLDKASANPNVRLHEDYDSPNDVTRVMPAIKEPFDFDKDDAEDDIPKQRDKPKKRDKSKTKLWIVAAVLLLTVAVVSGLIAYMSYTRGKEVAVPDILNKDEKTAEQMLKGKGLLMDAERAVSDKPEGIVFDTKPAVGMMVKVNSTVKVKVSSGPETVDIPDLTSMTAEEATSKLNELGLNAKITQINDNTIPSGKVVRQSATSAPKGGTVELFVSKGPEVSIVYVPSFESITSDKIKESVEAAGLKLAGLEYKYDPTKPDNVAVGQNIPKDTPVPQGTPIIIYINRTVPATS